MVVDVAVERTGDGELEVRWRVDPAVPVDVFQGTSPDDTAEPVATAHAGTSLVVSGLDPTVRHYFRVAAPGHEGVVAAERRLPLEGAMNLRDLGGYVAAG